MPSYQLLNDLYEKTQNAIHSLEQNPDGIYLGTATNAALNDTEFVSIAKEHVLVRKQAVVLDTPQQHNAPSSSSTSTVQSESSQNTSSSQTTQTDSQTPQSSPVETQPLTVLPEADNNNQEPIRLSFIAVVDSQSFFFTSDGKYNAQTSSKAFSDNKITCNLYSPDFAPIKQHFTNAINAIHHLENKVASPGVPIEGPVKEENNMSKIRIRHNLFEEHDHDVYDNSDPNDDLGEEFRIDRWPVLPRNTTLMNQIRNTHLVNPIPAFDVNNLLVRPNLYEDVLAGALVQVEITLQHWFFRPRPGSNPKHQISADVFRMKVLAPPKIKMSEYTTVKRGIKRMGLKEPGPSSPTKRIRSDN